MRISFTDGISIETAGPLRILHLSDGYYVVGEGNLIPVNDRDDGLHTIASMKVFRRVAKLAVVAAFIAMICPPHSALAETAVADLPKYNDMSASEKKCADEYIADDHPTAQEMAAYYRCAESKRPQPVAFKSWQRAWQCSDIRVTETVTQRGIVNYDLAGTIWGGSQFALDIQRGTMWFNGRPCVFLGGTP